MVVVLVRPVAHNWISEVLSMGPPEKNRDMYLVLRVKGYNFKTTGSLWEARPIKSIGGSGTGIRLRVRI